MDNVPQVHAVVAQYDLRLLQATVQAGCPTRRAPHVRHELYTSRGVKVHGAVQALPHLHPLQGQESGFQAPCAPSRLRLSGTGAEEARRQWRR